MEKEPAPQTEASQDPSTSRCDISPERIKDTAAALDNRLPEHVVRYLLEYNTAQGMS